MYLCLEFAVLENLHRDRRTSDSNLQSFAAVRKCTCCLLYIARVERDVAAAENVTDTGNVDAVFVDCLKKEMTCQNAFIGSTKIETALLGRDRKRLGLLLLHEGIRR